MKPRKPKERPHARAPGFDVEAAIFAVVLEDEAEEDAKEKSQTRKPRDK